MHESIFGSIYPKFVSNFGEVNEATVLMNFAVLVEDEPDVRKIVHESELETDRDFIYKGEFLEQTWRINLYKYSNPRNKFEEIYQYRHKKVVLYKHADGAPYYDKDGNEVFFYIDSVIGKHLQTLDYRDVIFVKFISTREIDLSDGSTIFPNAEEVTLDEDTLIIED